MNNHDGGRHILNSRKVYKDPKSAAHRKAKKEITHYKYIPPYITPALGNGRSKKLQHNLEEENRRN